MTTIDWKRSASVSQTLSHAVLRAAWSSRGLYALNKCATNLVISITPDIEGRRCLCSASSPSLIVCRTRLATRLFRLLPLVSGTICRSTSRLQNLCLSSAVTSRLISLGTAFRDTLTVVVPGKWLCHSGHVNHFCYLLTPNPHPFPPDTLLSFPFFRSSTFTSVPAGCADRLAIEACNELNTLSLSLKNWTTESQQLLHQIFTDFHKFFHRWKDCKILNIPHIQCDISYHTISMKLENLKVQFFCKLQKKPLKTVHLRRSESTFISMIITYSKTLVPLVKCIVKDAVVHPSMQCTLL